MIELVGLTDEDRWADRGSGRSLKQVKALKPGDIFIVHTWEMRRYTINMIRDQRKDLKVSKDRTPPDGVHVMVVEDRRDLQRLAGVRRRLVIDHAAWDWYPDDIRAELTFRQQAMA